jgi:hypothetical protein
MMDSKLFLRQLGDLYLWRDGARLGFHRFSLVYLDGSHDPDIVWSEVESLLHRVTPGGFLVIDDTDWFEGAVRKRIDQAAPRFSGTVRHHGKQTIISLGAERGSHEHAT